MNNKWLVISLMAILAAATLSSFPAVATDFAELVSCKTVKACQGGNNSGGGPGVRGNSARAAGVLGNSRSGDGVSGYSATRVGVYGGSAGARARGGTYGVYGFSHNVGVGGYGTGTGVLGISSTGNGMYGQTDAASSTFSNPPVTAGVFGNDATGNNAGVIGSSVSGVGVIGQIVGNSPCAPGPAVEGFSTGASAWLAVTAVTGFCQTAPLAGAIGDANIGMVATGETLPGGSGNPYQFGVGLEASGDVGAVISGSGRANPNSGLLPPALEVQEYGKGLLLSAIGRSGSRVMSLDSSGNLIISGKLTQHGRPQADSWSGRSLAGTTLAGYEGSRTIESVGEARLASGISSVRMSAAFVRDIDPAVRYEVFLTPEGPTAGLYVTQKSAIGFFVRENPGGHSNAAFTYRVVAKAIERNPAQPADENARYAAAISTQLTQRTVQRLKMSRPLPSKQHVSTRPLDSP